MGRARRLRAEPGPSPGAPRDARQALPAARLAALDRAAGRLVGGLPAGRAEPRRTPRAPGGSAALSGGNGVLVLQPAGQRAAPRRPGASSYAERRSAPGPGAEPAQRPVQGLYRPGV